MAHYDQDRMDDDRREREAVEQEAYAAYCDEQGIDPDDEDSWSAFEEYINEERLARAGEHAEDDFRERYIWAEQDAWEVFG